jgi:CubicO group peptidase (beta-lactamase class C family)
MIKRIVLIITMLFVAILGLLWWLAGLSPMQLPSAVALANGLGAKLMCSGRYVSGFDDERLLNDIATYNELTRHIDYSAPDSPGISASLFGSTPVVARFRPGLGCTLEYGSGSILDDISLPATAQVSKSVWPAGSGGAANNPEVQRLLETLLAQDNAAGLDTRALLVVQNGVIQGEAYGPGIDRDTALLGWSMGKSITAILLGRLEAQGLVGVEQANLFSQWAEDERRTITLEQLLQMRSGLDFSEEYLPGNDSTRMIFMSPSASSVALESSLAQVPGTFFSYSSGTTNLLARLVYDRAGGSTQALLDFYQHEIAAPLALENTWMELDASGVFIGSSFVYATARDWARFGYLMVNGGEINGHTIVTPQWIGRATHPNDSDNDRRYGYQFWLNDGEAQMRWPSLPRSAYSMQGNRKQVVMMLPEQKAVIVRLGWSPGEYPVDERFARISRLLNDA